VARESREDGFGNLGAFLYAHSTTVSIEDRSGFTVYSIYTAAMALTGLLVQIDLEIARLQQARALLASASIAGKRGQAARTVAKPAKKKRNLTPEGRARIAEAVKRRWAKQKAAKKGKA
jgi:hypothetical protein